MDEAGQLGLSGNGWLTFFEGVVYASHCGENWDNGAFENTKIGQEQCDRKIAELPKQRQRDVNLQNLSNFDVLTA